MVHCTALERFGFSGEGTQQLRRIKSACGLAFRVSASPLNLEPVSNPRRVLKQNCHSSYAICPRTLLQWNLHKVCVERGGVIIRSCTGNQWTPEAYPLFLDLPSANQEPAHPRPDRPKPGTPKDQKTLPGDPKTYVF